MGHLVCGHGWNLCGENTELPGSAKEKFLHTPGGLLGALVLKIDLTRDLRHFQSWTATE